MKSSIKTLDHVSVDLKVSFFCKDWVSLRKGLNFLHLKSKSDDSLWKFSPETLPFQGIMANLEVHKSVVGPVRGSVGISIRQRTDMDRSTFHFEMCLERLMRVSIPTHFCPHTTDVGTISAPGY